MHLPDYPADPQGLRLQASGSWPESRHVFDARQRIALRAAEAAGRPLLVRGEPGTGKSQLAHAAAVASGRRFVSCVVDARTEPSDLLWRYDPVARLADAQLAALPGAAGDAAAALDPKRYLTPGPLWWAFDWLGARGHLKASRVKIAPPSDPDWRLSSAGGTVLLIDEIDKAEAEVPNGLLEGLANGRFTIPQTGQPVECNLTERPPLVIITTNEERELPAAFLRRCLVLTLTLPPQGRTLQEYLVEIAKVHFPEFVASHGDVAVDVAAMLEEDRRAAPTGKPGLAEYLDMLRALVEFGGDPRPLLEVLREFTFRKQPADQE